MRTQRTPEQWQALFDAFKTSGQTQAQFCKDHGVNANYFSLKRNQQTQQQKRTAFVRLDDAPVTPARASSILIQYHHITVTLPGAATVGYLAQFVRALA
jgi:hypothetical protein